MPDGTPRLPPESTATFHPAADIFPLLTGASFNELVADIKARGLIHPIVEMGNAILDGRNRYLACNLAGVRIRTVKYAGNDPVGYVIATNLHRRHLNESQRAMVAARLADMPQGRPSLNAENSAFSQVRAAELLGVDRRTVQFAKTVQDDAIPALAARVDAGEVAVSVVAQIAELPRNEQDALAEAPEAVLRNAGKAAKRGRRERALAATTRAVSAAIGSKLYSVIYADPPWRFEPYSRETGLDRSADNHYPTETVDTIRALDVPAADNCVLFLWATVPMLPEALSVMEAWGFAYKSHCVWLKDRLGTGYWFRNCHELLLVGTRGDVPAPAPGTQFNSFIEAPVSDHSRKPFAFAEMIEELFPSADLLEMFARGTRAGWDTWGNEAP
jgi:N6-adenosine-specific RNA methylase IME4/ParB-like chromosome segregation protein Spo0J